MGQRGIPVIGHVGNVIARKQRHILPVVSQVGNVKARKQWHMGQQVTDGVVQEARVHYLVILPQTEPQPGEQPKYG